jgi:hypothetical protein
VPHLGGVVAEEGGLLGELDDEEDWQGEDKRNEEEEDDEGHDAVHLPM